MLTSDVNCLFTPRSEENNGKKTEIIDQPRFHADTHSTSQKCPLISSLTPLFDSTNYLALFRSYQRAIIHCQTFSVARGERNAHFSVLAPRLLIKQGYISDCVIIEIRQAIERLEADRTASRKKEDNHPKLTAFYMSSTCSNNNKTLRSVHFGVVVVQLINCKCGGIVRNQTW